MPRHAAIRGYTPTATKATRTTEIVTSFQRRFDMCVSGFPAPFPKRSDDVLAVPRAGGFLHGLLALETTNGGLGDFNAHFIRDLDLHALLADAGHLAVDATGRHD